MPEDYEVYYFDVFYEQYTHLISEVLKLRTKDPSGYKKHKKTKLLKQIKSVIVDQIAVNPQAPQFHMGDTFPKKYRMYKRAKAGLPARCRMFFRYKSNDGKIVIIWMNNENSLRGYGAKNDVYNVFLKMLKNGAIPPNWTTLVKKAKLPPEVKSARSS